VGAAEDLYPGLLLDPDEIGALRFAERGWPAPLFMLTWLALMAALAAVLVPRQGAEALAGPVTGVLMLLGLIALAGRSTVRVHDHAFVVHVRAPFAVTYVIPWTTVDAGLVRLHRSANFIGRRMGPHPPRERRMEPWHRTAVSVVGLAGDYASAKRREPRLALVRQQVVERPYEPVMPLPLRPWYLGTRREHALLEALEDALVRAGNAGAAGLAERCLADSVRERWPTPLSDQDIYGRPLPRRMSLDP
jgi:hypothetical protein